MAAMETCTKYLEKFVDHDKCLKLIDDLETFITKDKDELTQLSLAEKLVEDFRKIIDRYQEQPELLEPCLPELIKRLTFDIANKSSQNSVQYYATFKYLYQLIKVTGFKNVGKHFPHETDKLPTIVDLLAKEEPQNKLDWEARFVLIIWLSIVILTPFDLAKFDAGSSAETSPIASRIYTTILCNLCSHDSCQHVTAYCLAKYFSRPDVLINNKHLEEFYDTSLGLLSQLKNSKEFGIDVKLIGYVRTLAYMYKFLPTRELQRRSSGILRSLAELDVEKINSELLNHLLIKLVQRVGLALLPKSSASWRYKRGCRILGINQQSQQQQQGPRRQSEAFVEGIKPTSEHKTIAVSSEQESSIGGPSEAELQSTDWLESILSMLFVAAQNGQTKIRWSAAKGIARLASRMSRQRAGDVIDMVLANFFDTQTSSEYAWHGGCLTLAEMSRQGLILEEKLEYAIQVIGQAIIYDKIKGSFAVGAHVRESACYVIWAMARTYDDHHLSAYISQLSINLMCTIVFDRELQCRRAASATFQELIGRQGTFDPEALSLLANVDYQNVGQRQFSYIELASRVASIGGPKYHEPFIEHLLGKKIGHWDLQIRRLASDSLGLLMLRPSFEFIERRVLCQLEQFCEQQLDNNLKHGAILSLAKVIKSLVPLQFNFSDTTEQLVAGVCEKCDKQLKSKQQAANFLEAICQLIVAAEQAKFNFKYDSQTVKRWEQLVLQALDSDNAELREVASDAYLSLYRYYFAHSKTCQDRLLTIANKTLASPNESSRCGVLKCLSKLGLTLGSCDLMLDVRMANSDNTATSAEDQSNSNLIQATSEPDQQQPKINSNVQKQQQQQHFQLLRTGGEIKSDSDTPDIILMSLTGYLARETREKSSDQVFAQAKAECCDAFVNFVRLLDKSRLIISTHWLRAGLDALLGKSEDYTFDKRGDIGVQVRKAAIRALQELCCYLITINMSYPILYESDRMRQIVAKMLQQCVSYNNSARELAAISFYRLMAAVGQEHETTIRDSVCRQRLCNLVPHYDEIVNLFHKYQADKLEDFNWRDDSTPIFVELLSKQEYSQDIWLGLIPALGQASDLCAKQFRDALSDYIRKNLLCDDLDTCHEGQSDIVERKQLHDQVFESFLCTLERAGASCASGRGAPPQTPDGNEPEAKAGLAVTAASTTTMGNQRLLTVGLQATDYLLTQGLMNETSSKLQERLAELCWQASRVSSSSSSSSLLLADAGASGRPRATTSGTIGGASSTDPKRLVSVSRVLCSMLQFQSRQIQHKCLQYCLALLANSFATVRAYTAEQLYSNIMFQQLEGLGADEADLQDEPEEDDEQARQETDTKANSTKKTMGTDNEDARPMAAAQQQGETDELSAKRKQLDEALDLLSKTRWTEPLEKVRPIRAKICSLLGVYYSIDLKADAL